MVCASGQLASAGGRDVREHRGLALGVATGLLEPQLPQGGHGNQTHRGLGALVYIVRTVDSNMVIMVMMYEDGVHNIDT